MSKPTGEDYRAAMDELRAGIATHYRPDTDPLDCLLNERARALGYVIMTIEGMAQNLVRAREFEVQQEVLEAEKQARQNREIIQ